VSSSQHSEARELTAEEVERGYNNRAAVPDHPAWFARWAQLSDAARAHIETHEDVPYGAGPKETLDIFLPATAARGTLLFIHGGYWRALDKREHAFVAPVFVQQGYAVASVNYDLCPQVSIGHIVEEVQRALAWIVREGPAHGLTADNVVTSGHSACGHLAAMLHATDARTLGLAQSPIAGGVSLSGVHDLEPLLQFSFNTDFRLDEAEARRLSPVHLQPASDATFLVAAGANETSEFVRQAQLLWQAWPRNRPRNAHGPMLIPERHHFDVVLDYTDPQSELTGATLALFER